MFPLKAWSVMPEALGTVENNTKTPDVEYLAMAFEETTACQRIHK
jgi:hypothetical protein